MMLDSPPLQADLPSWQQWVLVLEALDPAEPAVQFALERAHRVLESKANNGGPNAGSGAQVPPGSRV